MRPEILDSNVGNLAFIETASRPISPSGLSLRQFRPLKCRCWCSEEPFTARSIAADVDLRFTASEDACRGRLFSFLRA